MVKVTIDGNVYFAFGNKEPLNPHEKGYPCLVDARTWQIPVGQQRAMILKMLKDLGVTYTKYKLKDTNTHDLVNVIIKMGKYIGG